MRISDWSSDVCSSDLQLRGPQHHFAWVDELAKFRYIQKIWDQLLFGLRLGSHPRVLVTTTPQPKGLIKALAIDPHTHVTRGATKDNLRSEEHTSELQSLMRISYAVFCLTKKTN